jgi:spore maturation protein CgeB
LRFIIVGDLFHPEELAKTRASNLTAESPLFPQSQAEYFYVRSLRKLGHQVEAFIRNVPAVFGVRARRSQRFAATKTAAMLVQALAHRAPRLQPDYWLRNRRLIAQVKRFEPDAVLIIGGNRVIFPETLARLKAEHGCQIIFMSGDSPIVFSNAIERASAPLYDLALVNDYYHGIQWLELGAPRMEVLPMSACDPEIHRRYLLTESEQAEFRCDVGFVGTLLPPKLYSQRAQALEAVRDCGLGVWSVHDVPAALRPYYRGPALGERMLRAVCGSAIQLNPNSNFMRYGGNMRLFEAPGCGVFQITNETPGASLWFTPGETIVTYRDLPQLRQLVEYYLTHDAEREQIAQAAQAHVYAHHTYDQRMARLVDLIGN